MIDLGDNRIHPLESTKYITQAFPHAEGILWVNGKCSVEISFVWHQYVEQPGRLPWPFLEITKRICDSTGSMHSTTSFVPAQVLFPRIHGSDVVTQSAFKTVIDRHDVEILTAETVFYSDSREVLYFNLCTEGWPSLETNIASHFDKHTGGKIRLLRVNEPWIFLEFEISYLDDRINNEFIDLDGSLFAKADLDVWTTRSHARDASEFLELYWREPFPGSPLPTAFQRCGTMGSPQGNVEFISEEWSRDRAREMVLEHVDQTIAPREYSTEIW